MFWATAHARPPKTAMKSSTIFLIDLKFEFKFIKYLFPRDRLDVANIGKKKELQASDVTFFSLKTPFCWPNNRYFERKSALLRLRNGLEAVAICNNISWKEIRTLIRSPLFQGIHNLSDSGSRGSE
jgi:hypothetical protein